jgi:hypothetical protein
MTLSMSEDGPYPPAKKAPFESPVAGEGEGTGGFVTGEGGCVAEGVTGGAALATGRCC